MLRNAAPAELSWAQLASSSASCASCFSAVSTLRLSTNASTVTRNRTGMPSSHARTAASPAHALNAKDFSPFECVPVPLPHFIREILGHLELHGEGIGHA